MELPTQWCENHFNTSIATSFIIEKNFRWIDALHDETCTHICKLWVQVGVVCIKTPHEICNCSCRSQISWAETFSSSIYYSIQTFYLLRIVFISFLYSKPVLNTRVFNYPALLVINHAR